jgi:TolB protein
MIDDPQGVLTGTVASAGLDVGRLRVLHLGIVGDTTDIYLTSQGDPPVKITDDPDEEQAQPPSFDTARRVIYSRYPPGQTAQADIVMVDPVSREVTPLLATEFDEVGPKVSPDGTRIVFATNTGEEYDIWVMGIDGSNPTRLTENPERDTNPSWSPDGERIIFSARHSENADIWIMDADGSNLEQITDHEAGEFDPVFSPDGSKIAFTSRRDGTLDIWLMNADGSDPVNLTNHPAADEYPSWSADGEFIVFTSDRLSTLLWVMRADGSGQTVFTLLGPSGYGTVVPTR